MKALVLRKPGDMIVLDIPDPRPRPGYAVVKVESCALCRTDAKMMVHGQRDLILPRILGHEIVGIREDTYERVAVWPAQACGVCVHCVSGKDNQCDAIGIIGFNMDGGLAESLLVSESSLHPIPDSLDIDVACLAEPLACAINALEQTNIAKDQTALIFGGGSLGFLLALAAKAFGAFPTIKEIDPQKWMKSRQFLNGLGVSNQRVDDSKDYDVAINACPSTIAVIEGLQRLKKGGCFCHFSGLAPTDSMTCGALNEIHYRQLHMVGAYGCATSHFRSAIELLERHQETARLLIESKIDLEQVPAALLEILCGRPLKILADLSRLQPQRKTET